jgi:hypothetical protein
MKGKEELTNHDTTINTTATTTLTTTTIMLPPARLTWVSTSDVNSFTAAKKRQGPGQEGQ